MDKEAYQQLVNIFKGYWNPNESDFEQIVWNEDTPKGIKLLFDIIIKAMWKDGFEICPETWDVIDVPKNP